MADIIKKDKPEAVQLSRALEQIENALAGVLNRIQQLNEESQQAKREISETFGRQFIHLHSRETQLLRQVDVIFHARGELLQKQLAYCYRVLGALETSQKWSEQLQKHNCEVTINQSELEVMRKWATTIPLNWSLDENDLNEAIANFGKVDMEAVLLLSNQEQSKCLPGRLEEYFEEEHQVMNKPLHSNVIDIRFPKLPKDYSYWLSRPTQHEEKLDTTYGPYRKAADSYKPCDVQTWLGCIQNETAAEPMDEVSDSSQEIATISDTCSMNSKESDSIEIVSISNFCLKSNKEHGEGCHQALVDFEIENLADNLSCLKTEKQRLVTPNSNEIPLTKACRANAVCESYEACVCDLNCHDLALKNRAEKEAQEMKQEDYSKWLYRSSPETTSENVLKLPQFSLFSEDDYTKWLHPDSLASLSKTTTTNKILKYPCIYSDTDYGDWLHPESLAVMRSSKDAANSLFKYHVLRPIAEAEHSSVDTSKTATASNDSSNIWLANSFVNQMLQKQSLLSVSKALNEIRQGNGKLTDIQHNWAQWLKR